MFFYVVQAIFILRNCEHIKIRAESDLDSGVGVKMSQKNCSVESNKVSVTNEGRKWSPESELKNMGAHAE